MEHPPKGLKDNWKYGSSAAVVVLMLFAYWVFVHPAVSGSAVSPRIADPEVSAAATQLVATLDPATLAAEPAPPASAEANYRYQRRESAPERVPPSAATVAKTKETVSRPRVQTAAQHVQQDSAAGDVPEVMMREPDGGMVPVARFFGHKLLAVGGGKVLAEIDPQSGDVLPVENHIRRNYSLRGFEASAPPNAERARDRIEHAYGRPVEVQWRWCVQKQFAGLLNSRIRDEANRRQVILRDVELVRARYIKTSSGSYDVQIESIDLEPSAKSKTSSNRASKIEG